MPFNVVSDSTKTMSLSSEHLAHSAYGTKSIGNAGPRTSRSSSIKMLKQKLQSLAGTSPMNPAPYSPRNSLDVHSFTLSNDDLSGEAADFSKTNMKPYNDALASYLSQCGFSTSLVKFKHGVKIGRSALKIFGSSTPKSVQAFLSGTGQMLFLPYNPTRKKDQPADDALEEDEEGDMDESDIDETPEPGQQGPRQPRTLHHTVASHTFVVVIRLLKSQSLTSVARARYYADATTNWTSGISVENSKGKYKLAFKEKYRVSKDIDWDLDLRNPDCFIPFKVFDSDPDSAEEFNFEFAQDAESEFTSSTKASAEILRSSSAAQELRYYEPLNPKDFVNEIDDNGKDTVKHEDLFAGVEAEARNFQPGYYVFLLPVVYPINAPETIRTPLATVSHNLHVQLESAQYVPAIAPPPSALLSVPQHHRYEDTDMVGSYFNSNTSKSIRRKIGRRRSSSVSSTGSASHKPANPMYDFSHELPVIRLPPFDATSTLNKSIYVNKIWSDSLNYEILLPRKFIQLSPKSGINDTFMRTSTFVLQMKLIPLVKNLSLKRIKINIVEKITYISKDRKYETEVGSMDRSGCKERKVTMMEIKTKEKNHTSAMNTQIIKGCVNENLLTFCYNNGKLPDCEGRSRSGSLNNLHLGTKRMAKLLEPSKNSSSSSLTSTPQEEVSITNPIKLQCPLRFIANDEMKFISETHDALTQNGIDGNDHDIDPPPVGDQVSIFSMSSQGETDQQEEESSGWLSKSPLLSPILSPKKSNCSPKMSAKEEDRLQEFSFYPDTNFHNVNIKHRLQVCFRISKPYENKTDHNGEPKMHHYEVIVDTPIVFVSPFCVRENVELPSYEYAVRSSALDSSKPTNGFAFSADCEQNNDIDEDLPTFEEAVLQPSSPMMSGYNIPNQYFSTFNSTTMLSQSPFSIGSSSPPASYSMGHNGSSLSGLNLNNLNNLNDVSFNNLDSLLQTADANNEELFAKKDIKPSSAGGQLSSLLKPSDSKENVISPPAIIINGKFDYENASHVPSRSSLAYYEDDLPSYQKVIEQDSHHMEENLGLLSDGDDIEGDETFHLTHGNQSLCTLDLNTVPAQATSILD
ncbi:hypothetical protein KL923_000429 [Ogataea haglerorum]|nr:hypothetical protein KL923_000429 [Ogataea haglerorum]